MKILGLDLGTNSIGWAIVEKEEGKMTLLNKGVRIFQEGVKIEKGVEGSKAAKRTDFRSARRLKYRRRIRKINTLKVLSKYGYCPELSDDELNNWRYKKQYPKNDLLIKWWTTNEKEDITPYYYRNLTVVRKLDLNDKNNRFAIGRAIYHMAQRRGFLSNRLESTKESDGIVKKSIEEITKAKSDKTLGQYFYEKYKKGEKIRDTYTHREKHYLQEFKQICIKQDLPEEFAKKVHRAIFYQRPLKSQKGLIGKCVFEPTKKRCAVSRPEFEEYRMLCFINSIKIRTPFDEKLRFLNEEEKDLIIPQFFRKSKEYFDFEDIAKQLAPKKQYKYYKDTNRNPEDWLFNYTMKTSVSGCPVSTRFKELFGDDFLNIQFDYVRERDNKESNIDINDIWHVLYTFDSDDKLAEFAKARLKFNDEQLQKFVKIRLKRDYTNLSLKAIRKILPFLHEGLIYSHAVFLANMEEIIPKRIWSDIKNRELIRNEVYTIIQTHNEKKQIYEIVNGLIKNIRENNSNWSTEAALYFKKDLNNKIEAYFGRNRYETFPDERKERIEKNAFDLLEKQMQKKMGNGEFVIVKRIDECVFDFITDNFDIENNQLKKLYHPSSIDVYKPQVKSDDGKCYLGSPMIQSVRNPMAMRAIHQLRKVVNELIKTGQIDVNTRVNIEMARGLMNANERKALQSWQRDNEKKRKEYTDKIKEYIDTREPSEEEILKYKLWEEQKHKCLYTGNEIGISEFLGSNPKYDIEHTIPRSLSFDNSQVNKTLCESKFNRSIKKNRIPFELSNHLEILKRIEHWKKKFEDLDKQINIAVRQSRSAIEKDSKDRAIQRRHKLNYERNYWRSKYQRFVIKDVPEGFKNSQLVDTGIITKYSRLYLKTVFDKVYTVKGSTVADFRKMWGLQDGYVKKERVNHIHHCIDAITIASITKENYENLAKFYKDWEDLDINRVGKKPYFDKPWKTFTEDIISIENEILVSHYTPDNLPKQSKKKLRKRGKIQYNKSGDLIYQKGDTVRGSLHQQTFYGAIEREIINKKGEVEKQIKYVVRKPLDTLEDSNIKNIVDDRIRDIVSKDKIVEKELKKEVEALKKKLQKAEVEEELEIQNQISEVETQISSLFTLPNKNGEPIPVKRVRIFQPTVTNPLHIKKQRDKSRKKTKLYKEEYHVANDSNYFMAIYEGKDDKGKIKRDFEIVNNFEAGKFFKHSTRNYLKVQRLSILENLIPSKKVNGKIELALKGIIKTGTLVLFWQNNPLEIWDLKRREVRTRLYKVIKQSKDGRITFKFHQEARNDDKLRLDYEQRLGVKPPKSLTNGESKINFEIPYPKLLLSPSNFNMLIEGVDFKISRLGELQKIK
ncbi:type II CRISPR RNA-guided endonuclease Cas9 [Bacteroidota bacterium]